MSDQPGVDQTQNVNININVPDDTKHGTYANFFVSRATQQEFVLDFCQLLPSSDPGTIQADVVSRVYMTPQTAAQMINALNQRFREFQQQAQAAQAAARSGGDGQPSGAV